MSGGKARTFMFVQEGTMGDVNGDGIVNGRDIIRLKKYLLYPSVRIRKNLAMLNDDDVIDSTDLELLVDMIMK